MLVRLLPALLALPRLPRPGSMAPKRKVAAAAAAAVAAADGNQVEAAVGVEAAHESPEAKPKVKARRAAKPPPPPPGPVYDPATMRPPPVHGSDAFRILCWNVAGLRALLKKDPRALAALAAAERADVLCLQEHKLQEGKNCEEADVALAELLPGWEVHWSCSTERKGYSGTALLCRPGAAPLSVACGLGPGNASHEGEGRVLTAEFPAFFLVNVYVPNSGDKLKRLDYRVGEWDPALAAYLKGLEEKGKPVVVAGDLNCAAEEIDIHNPKGNLRSAGFTPEERASFAERLLQGVGLVDAFRAAHPGVVGYTYWGYRGNDLRGNNKGWRLDYFLVSEALYAKVHDCFHLPAVLGSDHCPLGLVLKL